MDQATNRRLVRGAETLGVPLDGEAVRRLDRYFELLLTWNQRINLTAIVEPAAIVDRHFLDSLAVAPLLDGAGTLLDVGSGAGFPGVVLAVTRPALQVTLVESIQKKVAFLQTLKREVTPNLEPLALRLESLPRERRFDAVISRATWEPSEWLRRGAPWVGAGGLLIAMQTLEQPAVEAPAEFVALPAIEYTVGTDRRRLRAFRRS